MHELLEKYIVSKLDNNKYCKSNGQFFKHLRENNLTFRDYYELFYLGYSPVCSYCCCRQTSFYRASLTYSKACNRRECISQSIRKGHLLRDSKDIEISNKKRKDTNILIYNNGVNSTPEQLTARTQRMIDSGVYTIIAVKGSQVKLEKYGSSTYNNPNKISESWRKRSNDKNRQTVQKRRNTCLKLYGVENILMLPAIKSKVNRFNGQSKEYKFPSGNKVIVSGYEPIALDLLLEKYSEQDIIVGQFFESTSRKNYNIPTFNYKNIKGTTRIYYPDLYVPSENKIIEVKSRWWYEGSGDWKYYDRKENNLRKKNACLLAGYVFEFWILNSKGIEEIVV